MNGGFLCTDRSSQVIIAGSRNIASLLVDLSRRVSGGAQQFGARIVPRALLPVEIPDPLMPRDILGLHEHRRDGRDSSPPPRVSAAALERPSCKGNVMPQIRPAHARPASGSMRTGSGVPSRLPISPADAAPDEFPCYGSLRTRDAPAMGGRITLRPPMALQSATATVEWRHE